MSQKSKMFRYGGAVAIVGLATIARFALDPVLGNTRSLITYLPTIMFTAWAFGSGPTLLAVFLSLSAATYFFLPPRHSFTLENTSDQVGLLVFLAFGLAAVLFSGQLHRARERDEWRQRQQESAQALLDSERRFRQLADAMPQMVWTMGPDGQFNYYNERWYEYTGLPKDRRGEESWVPALHPDDVARSKAAWREAIEHGRPYQVEYRVKDVRTDNYRWHLGRAVPGRDEAGIIVQWFGTSTDIDDQKRVEEKLQQAHDQLEQRVRERTLELTEANRNLSREVEERRAADARLREQAEKIETLEERFQAFMDHLPAGAWILDDQSRCLFVNRFYSMLTGLEVGCTVGKTSYDLYPPGIAVQHRANDGLALEIGAGLEVEEPYIRPDGTPGELLVVKFPITERGQGLRIGGVAIDVTDRKRAEDRMRRLAAQLGTAEDTERRRLATDLHDSIGQSLSLLKLNLEPLTQQAPNGPVFLRALTTSLQLLDNVIKQTRTLMFELYPTMLHDLGLVPTLLWYSEQLSAQAQVTVSEIGKTRPLPSPLASYLFRAAKELLGNAVRHGRAREIIVAVHWRRDTLKLVIDDDGCGFDPVKVLAPQTQRGLGLAGIHERLLSFSGKMFIESDPGRGTRIIMEAPLPLNDVQHT
jgi:PAS domain S-box-containing protein